jgi:hypothetical protein
MIVTLWILGGLLGLGGLVLAAWALFGDRSRARRCRGCWYSMEGVPGLTCPECGWEAKSEGVLTRRRRRWRVVILGVVLAGGGAGMVVNKYVSRLDAGWWSVTPTVGLVVAFRLHDSQALRDEIDSRDIATLPGFAKRMLVWKVIASPPVLSNVGIHSTITQIRQLMSDAAFLGRIIARIRSASPRLIVDVGCDALASGTAQERENAIDELLEINAWRVEDYDLQSRLLYLGDYTTTTYTSGIRPLHSDRSLLTRANKAAILAWMREHAAGSDADHAIILIAGFEPFDAEGVSEAIDCAAGAGTLERDDACWLAFRVAAQRGAPGHRFIASYLNDSDAAARRAALVALGGLEGRASMHLNAIDRARRDLHPGVAAAAAWAADAVRGEADGATYPPRWQGEP